MKLESYIWTPRFVILPLDMKPLDVFGLETQVELLIQWIGEQALLFPNSSFCQLRANYTAQQVEQMFGQLDVFH